jgi:hypothetical protein
VDYIDLGDERKVAEVQWKSGGPGLFFGIRDACARAMPDPGPDDGNDAVAGFGDAIWRSDDDTGPVAMNVIRDVWRRGEQYLERTFRARDRTYLAVDRAAVGDVLVSQSSGFGVAVDGAVRQLGFLSGQGFSRGLSEGLLTDLTTASLTGTLWIEAPLNYIYRQKWGLALPFMEEFRDHFDPRLREILAPTALLTGTTFDLRTIVPHLVHPERERLSKPIAWEDFAGLPASLRKCLVFKCGAGVGPHYTDSKGVFRVGGAMSTARTALAFMVARMVELGEPWIVQPYFNRTYSVPLCLPARPEHMQVTTAHARFMIFGRKLDQEHHTVLFGLANYDQHWKVTGRAPALDSHGRLTGSAFTDIRLHVPENRYVAAPP